ncbi:MAG: hypothetical protein WBV46_16375 [Terriglobales bacterium]
MSNSTAAASPADSSYSAGLRHPTLGLCWIVYGILRLAAGVWLIFFTPTATVMFGALLNRVADPFPLLLAFHFFYTCAIVLSAAAGVVGLIAGLMLMSGGRSSRTLAILAAILSVSNLPVGTTLGVYTLVLLLR